MKKVSVSLFAILAIVVAVGSAFTTAKKNTFVPDTWRAYYVSAGQLNSSSPLTSISNSAADAAIVGTLIHQSTTAQFELDDFNPDCSEPATQFDLCAAEIAYESNSPASGNIVDFVYGENTVE